MKNTKQSLTFIVIAGYLLLAALAVLAVWFIYSQVITYTSITENDFSENNKLYLVGEAATNLYETESISRQLIQTGDTAQLDLYKQELDSIRNTLGVLRNTYADTLLRKEIDSINFLLSQKTENLEELLTLRLQQGDQSYYSKVISELRKVDETFDDRSYEERFKDLAPHQRRVLIKLLEYSEMEESSPVPQQTVDSMVNQVKTILVELEQADRRYRESLRSQENQLLANELRLNSQLRSLLSTIEAEERAASLAQVEASQNVLRNTSRIVAVLAAAGFLVILIFLFLVVRDVSHSQRYRVELEEAKQYAESLLASREQFMATITHDLRSPLNTVLGYTALLEQTRLDKPQNRYLNHLKKSSEYILRLVNDLLDFSKLQAGKISIEKLPFNPKNLIIETVENTIPAKKKEEISVRTDIAPELDRSMISDPFRIKQILTNLVSNACKFTEEGEITVEAFLLEKKAHSFLKLIVRDTGIGISKDKVQEVFEEFSQEDASIERRFGGSGLGLAISKKLTELLRGKIELKSEPGKGSEFILEIPVELSVEEKPVTKVPQKLLTDPERFTVLIADDEPSQLSLLSELVKSTGMKTTTAGNGKEALEKLRTGNYHLLLTDIQMPEMDGIELISRIRTLPELREIPVIALSGKTDISPAKYSKMGFSGNLEKPYSSTKLLHLISKVLQVRLSNSEPKVKKEFSGNNFTLSEISKFAGGDQKALKNILEAFISSTEKNIKALEQTLYAEEHDKTSALAHRMLPMFRQLQTKTIIKKLQFLEENPSRAAKDHEVTTVIPEIKDLLEELKKEIKD